MGILNHTNLCHTASDIYIGDILVIQRKQDKRNIIVKVKDVVNKSKPGFEEVVLSAKNDYFIWSMFEKGESWVWRVWNLGQVEITNITNTLNEFPR